MKKHRENVYKVSGAEGSQVKEDRERNNGKCLTPELKDELGGRFENEGTSLPFAAGATAVSVLKPQKRLTSRVLCCGKKKIWLDSKETNEIAIANSPVSRSES